MEANGASTEPAGLEVTIEDQRVRARVKQTAGGRPAEGAHGGREEIDSCSLATW